MSISDQEVEAAADALERAFAAGGPDMPWEKAARLALTAAANARPPASEQYGMGPGALRPAYIHMADMHITGDRHGITAIPNSSVSFVENAGKSAGVAEAAIVAMLDAALEQKNKPVYGMHKGDWSPLSHAQIAKALSPLPVVSSPVGDEPRPLVDELTGALRFIMAFYEPGQTYLDTNAWKVAEAGGRNALAKGEAYLAEQAGIAALNPTIGG